ncbi:hypothetical protein ACFE04_020248 [Oxalis oulophora]
MEEAQEEYSKLKAVKVTSVESWDLYITQATNQGCPVVVHFTTTWCMPSVAMNPFFEELASSYPDVLFLIVDVDELKEVATRMDVKAMPTFLLIKDGSPADKLVGANPDEMKKRIDTFVQSSRTVVYVA